MKEQPVVTIGIPFYNEERFIAATIESALNQTYRNIKIILSDNCSADSSFSIAQKYAETDSRIELIKQESNIGPSSNFQFVFDKARSKYFMWLGGHDVITPEYIEQAVQVLEQDTSIALAYPGAESTDVNGKPIETINDDYDTTGLTKSRAILKIALKFYNGYVIHGVFRTAVLQSLPIEKVNSPDMLITILVNLYGSIKRIPVVGFLRRVVREETHEDQKRRHIEQKIYKEVTENPFDFFVLVLFKKLLKARQLSFFSKPLLMLRLKRIFAVRFNVTWKGVLRSLFYSH